MSKLNTTPQDVLHAVCLYYGTPHDKMAGLSRKADLVRARAMYFYLARTHTTAPFSVIGELIDRDHATALYHSQKLGRYMTRDEQTEYHELRNIILDIHINPFLGMYNNLGRFFWIIREKEFAFF